MKKITFKVMIQHGDKYGEETREGYLYYCEATQTYFTVHKTDQGSWIVSDYLTGYKMPMIFHSEKSRKEAINNLEKHIPRIAYRYLNRIDQVKHINKLEGVN